LKENQDTSFFLYLAYTVPHSDYEIPDTTPYTDSLWTDNEKIHAAMITRMDRDIGRMMQLLTDLGIDDNTMVFFCSDNGAAEFWEGRFDSSYPLRGRKRDMYEGGLRTPMVVRYPGKVPAGEVRDQPWYFPDVLPTLAAVAGAIPPANIDGISVLPLLFGESQETGDRIFYWEFWERGFQQAARWRNWKAVKLGPDLDVELYDLSIDISEEKNLAAQHPDIVKLFEEAFVNERVPSPFWPDFAVD
jgi:arylsulfatase A-like enzyme